MIVKRNEFVALFLKMIQKDLEKHLPEEDSEDEYLRHAGQITVEKLKHIAEAV